MSESNRSCNRKYGRGDSSDDGDENERKPAAVPQSSALAGRDHTVDGGLLPEGYVPSYTDVICGRSRSSSYHARGNRRFRRILEKNVPIYLTAQSKDEKTQTVISTILQVQDTSSSSDHETRSRALFIRKVGEEDDKEKTSKDANARWEVLTHTEVREKVSHALRKTVKRFEQDNPAVAARIREEAAAKPPEKAKGKKRMMLRLLQGDSKPAPRKKRRKIAQNEGESLDASGSATFQSSDSPLDPQAQENGDLPLQRTSNANLPAKSAAFSEINHLSANRLDEGSDKLQLGPEKEDKSQLTPLAQNPTIPTMRAGLPHEVSFLSTRSTNDGTMRLRRASDRGIREGVREQADFAQAAQNRRSMSPDQPTLAGRSEAAQASVGNDQSNDNLQGQTAIQNFLRQQRCSKAQVDPLQAAQHSRSALLDQSPPVGHSEAAQALMGNDRGRDSLQGQTAIQNFLSRQNLRGEEQNLQQHLLSLCGNRSASSLGLPRSQVPTDTSSIPTNPPASITQQQGSLLSAGGLQSQLATWALLSQIRQAEEARLEKQRLTNQLLQEQQHQMHMQQQSYVSSLLNAAQSAQQLQQRIDAQAQQHIESSLQQRQLELQLQGHLLQHQNMLQAQHSQIAPEVSSSEIVTSARDRGLVEEKSDILTDSAPDVYSNSAVPLVGSSFHQAEALQRHPPYPGFHIERKSSYTSSSSSE